MKSSPQVTVSGIRAKQSQLSQASAKNRRLAEQMSRRPGMDAALKAARRANLQSRLGTPQIDRHQEEEDLAEVATEVVVEAVHLASEVRGEDEVEQEDKVSEAAAKVVEGSVVDSVVVVDKEALGEDVEEAGARLADVEEDVEGTSRQNLKKISIRNLIVT